MPSLLLVMFVLQLVIHIINSVGASAVNDLAWAIYNKFGSTSSAEFQKGHKQRAEILTLKQQLSSVSAQDDFARWARIRRKHDKLVAEYDKIASSLKTNRSSFDSTVGWLRWLSTNGLRLILQFRYSRAPIFWLPAGLMPGAVEWALAFPRAPRGSVSISVWATACASVVAMAAEAVAAARTLARTSRESKQPLAMPAAGVGAAKPRDKKEL